MSDRFDITELLFLHKVIYELIPVELPSYMSFFQGQSRLRSSHLDNLSLVSSVRPNVQLNTNNVASDYDRASSNPFYNSYFYRVHFKWNDLPITLREIENHKIFKTELFKHFWKNMRCEGDVDELMDLNDELLSELG